MAGNTVFDFVNQDGNDQDAICQHKRCKYLLYGLPGHYPGVGSRRGLMTPFYIPKLPGKALEDLKSMSYQHRAVYIMKQFLEEFSVKELTDFAAAPMPGEV